MTIDDFVSLVRDELGIEVTSADVGRGLDQLSGWDSVHLLWLMTAVEEATGRRVSLPDVMEATSLQHIYQVAVAS